MMHQLGSPCQICFQRITVLELLSFSFYSIKTLDCMAPECSILPSEIYDLHVYLYAKSIQNS